MRYRNNITFCADGGKRLPARRFVSVPDTAWIGRGTAFGTPKAQRRCTLLVVWYAEQEEPWIILTDLPPEAVGVSWYALRFWIELGFKAIKSLGWKWDKTRRTDPTRVSRHWLVLSVATLLALAYGTRAEDAHDRRIAPGNLRAPPKSLAPQHRNSWQKPKRKVSVFRHGIDWLRRLMHKGRLWNRVWLLPEPWPKHKPNLEITCHAPPLKTLYIPLSAPGAGKVVRPPVAGPRLDGFGGGRGLGTGPPHHWPMGVRFPRGRSLSLDFRADWGSPPL